MKLKPKHLIALLVGLQFFAFGTILSINANLGASP
jgi:uncharacterized membrane protein YczE